MGKREFHITRVLSKSVHGSIPYISGSRKLPAKTRRYRKACGFDDDIDSDETIEISASFVSTSGLLCLLCNII